MPEASVLMVGTDPAVVETALVAGRLACPGLRAGPAAVGPRPQP